MPRDIDDHQMRRRDRDREHGEITGEEIRDRDRQDPDMSGSDVSDPDTRRNGSDRRSSWDDDEDDMQEGYR
ncbi:hypothetical protein AAW14_06835 [Streptomyces hygroscopicus]|uniref:hypothetical protein n=1 Tax=Streptomyces hygroscopicus TaxID=1912 RepID=UPI0022403F55|nr:hypothetical protein [Streptomyces hygroscopicus]MCW7941780.1 hypothetical protein [Streptomyces hygroscopicus]